MGILDDAIREHLDLKRRRGADPTEVERAEREALGPVRRAPEAGPSAEVAEHPMPPGGAYDHEDDHEAGWSQEGIVADPADPYAAHQPPAAIPAVEEAPFAEDDLLAEDDPFAADEPSHGEREYAQTGAEHHPAPPPPHPAGGETAEYDVDEALRADRQGEGAGDEDVLEETPEFLQDTPDHDRLWFEQRPPKDFDFDG